MPRYDLFHNVVKQALLKDGWTITDDPLKLSYGNANLFVDLAAEKLIVAEKATQKIAVEVKSFASDSTTYEFHNAVGQFINYRTVLQQSEPERILYLAVPSDIFQSFFTGKFAQLIIEQVHIKVLSCNPNNEVVEQWIN